MSIVLFCACLFLMLLSLLFDLRIKRLLRVGIQTREKKAILQFWPLQVLAHLVLFYAIASTPIIQRKVLQMKVVFRSETPRAVIPSFPPQTKKSWKKPRVENI